jgi:hypothetical protein
MSPLTQSASMAGSGTTFKPPQLAVAMKIVEVMYE